MTIQFQNGLSAELYVASYLAGKGFGILWPMLTQSRYDFVIETPSNAFQKVQVKKATWSKAGNYEYLQARISGKSKVANPSYQAADVDIFAFTDSNKIWLAPFAELEGMTSVCLGSTNPNYAPYTKYTAADWLV